VELQFDPLELAGLPGDLAAALAYWQQLSGAKDKIPSWSDFELQNIPPRVLVTTHVTDVVEKWEDYRIRFWGSGFVDIHNQEATHQWVSEIDPPELGAAVVENIAAVVDAGEPRAYTILLQTPGRPQKFQVVLRLPLSDDGQTVNHVVTVSEFPQGRYWSQDAFKDLG